MPLYVYRCQTCGEEFEELQKIGAVAPATPSDGCPSNVPDGTTCPLERVMTPVGHRFKADYSSDGVGGYERQGEVMIRQVKGKNSQRYGMDKSGNS